MQPASVVFNRLLARGKFRHLQVLLKLAEGGSVQRTADAIGQTQSSVTQTLAYLEGLLETRLFERHARGVRPTAACLDLLPIARQMFMGLAQGAELVAARSQRGQGVVRLATSLAAMHGLLIDALPRFSQRHPDILVQLSEAEGDDQLLAITRGEVDLIACRRPAIVPDGWSFSALVDDRFAVLCGADHPLALRRSVALQDLAEQTWLLSPAGSAARERFDALAAEFPHPPRTHPIVTRSPTMLWRLLRDEALLALLPFSFAGPLAEQHGLREVRAQVGFPLQPIGLLHRSQGSPQATERLIHDLSAWVAAKDKPKKQAEAVSRGRKARA